MSNLVMSGDLTVEWLGCTTFRIQIAGLTLMFDAYLDKAPGAEPAELSVADITAADFVFVTHSHFDHIVDAGAIAAATGAAVVGSHQSVAILRAGGVAEDQLLPVSGGETVDCGRDIKVRVLPGLHSCLFAPGSKESGAVCLGDLGVPLQQRLSATRQVFEAMSTLTTTSAEYFTRVEARCSTHDGGPLMFLLETSRGSVLLNASSGHWSWLMSGLRPDVALLALAGRPNVDGEPFQGSLAQFLLQQVVALKPSQVALCHHDALLPPAIPAIDTDEALSTLARDGPFAALLELPLAEAVPVTF
jgi:L-ascorbate metabolism protein UlaG (beta-lactamase superfamily)